MYKIDRNKSNKLINAVKVIAFASCLELMMPITVEAKDTTSIENMKENMNTSAKLALGCYGGSVVILVGLGFIYKLTSEKDDDKNNKRSK